MCSTNPTTATTIAPTNAGPKPATVNGSSRPSAIHPTSRNSSA